MFVLFLLLWASEEEKDGVAAAGGIKQHADTEKSSLLESKYEGIISHFHVVFVQKEAPFAEERWQNDLAESLPEQLT